jgi:hypothetical protein
LGEGDAALAILERDLRWLLGCNPASLGTRQRKIRDWAEKAQALRTWPTLCVRIHLIAKARAWMVKARTHLMAIFGIAGRAHRP